MSTVLWSNNLIDGVVTSDTADKYALYKYSRKLDQIARNLGVTPFLDVQDTTDAEFNLSDSELPDEMESTDELMAARGRWTDAATAVEMLQALLDAIKDGHIRFGLLTNAHAEVVAELEESLAFAVAAASKSGKFNFAVVT